MLVKGKRVLVCSCEGTMSIDRRRLAEALGGKPSLVHHHLCLGELDSYREALAGKEPVLVCCTQEAPLFTEVAEDAGRPGPDFVDIRERAGWSDQGAQATPKMAALIAEAALPLPVTPAVTLQSGGRTIVYASDETGLEAAARLAADRAVTCLLMPSPDGVIPPAVRRVALFRGRITGAKGYLGAFDLTVAGLTAARPSSRSTLVFDLPVRAEGLTAEVLLDLSGGPALFPGGRDGYLRADPRAGAEVEKALAEARGLVGSFVKPRYVKVDPARCAHSRNGTTGCTRCLDACPSSAVLPAGDAVEVDIHACSGHGACSAVCPTGAITYDLPAGHGLFERLRVLLATYHKAGGAEPQLLLYDLGHGSEVIAGLARHDRGLPANVIPFGINQVTAVGLDFVLSALAYGAARLLVLAGPHQHEHLASLGETAGLAERIVTGLGHAGARLQVIEDMDPAHLAEILRRPAPPAIGPAASHQILGGRRETLGLALGHLHATAPVKPEAVLLSPGSPLGRVVLDQDRCTLCHSCTMVCPTQALGSNPDKPLLSFLEGACVQCGLCRLTCPERAITLEPRVAFGAAWHDRGILKEEEPFGCIRCGKPFATRSTVERMIERLAGHAMFADSGRLDLIKMCEDCRVIAQLERPAHLPLSGGRPPIPRTTDDYKKGEDDEGDA